MEQFFKFAYICRTKIGLCISLIKSLSFFCEERGSECEDRSKPRSASQVNSKSLSLSLSQMWNNVRITEDSNPADQSTFIRFLHFFDSLNSAPFSMFRSTFCSSLIMGENLRRDKRFETLGLMLTNVGYFLVFAVEFV